ncbi:hypothetical protein ACFS5L_16930 [Streptomyces phyllanthi]|uniref:Peptidase inhibitor family I36 protein n=1 Tax=Streptomyces phyllanthi TaxID=1803180 RepID=A0A5N8WFB0_9ACTN|nr:hypothetical protein [Streptomyces phyllanthi]MPY46171.1 hypothetical protein [Streptomyces phyllanthi]
MSTRTARAGLRSRLGIATGIAAVMAAAGTLLGAAPASASDNCSSGYHCVFWTDIYNSARHSYFDTDTNFSNDTFNQLSGQSGYGSTVNNNSIAASNNSNSGYESHFYDSYSSSSGWLDANRLFCVNPGSEAYQSEIPSSLWNRASALRLRGTTSISCF